MIVKGVCIILCVFFVLAFLGGYNRYRNAVEDEEGNGWLVMLFVLLIASLSIFFMIVSTFESGLKSWPLSNG